MNLPRALREFAAEQMLGPERTAFAEFDAEVRLRTVGGNTRLFGAAALDAGTALADVAPFTTGLVPGPEPVLLPRIATAPNCWVDVTLFTADDAGFLLLQDVTTAVHREAELLQQANELALMKRSPGAPDQSFKTFFSALNLLTVRYLEGKLVPLGDLPAWGGRFVPLLDAPNADWQDDPAMAFLGAFLAEAKAFWSQADIGSIRSGVWIDDDLDGTEFLYEATAAYTGSQKVLVITRTDSASAEKQSLIQTGRDLALSHRDLDRNQAQLLRANTRLQKRNRSRSQDLEALTRELETARRERAELEGERATMLEAAQQAQRLASLGTLAGGIAHDFNNVLAAILGFAELGQTPDAGSTTDCFRSIEAAALRAQDLVRQILAMTGPERTESQLLRVNDIVNEVVGLMRATLPGHIRLRTDLRADATVEATPTEVHQVLMNLCTNAAHAMREHGGTLGVELHTIRIDEASPARYEALLPGTYAVLSVTDDGTGIAAEDFAKVFTPFFTTKAPGEGTGIGLAVVQGIVTAAGGLVDVRSEPGQGTVFEVYWPLSAAQPSDEAPAEHDAGTGREHILFVDDEPMQVEVAAKMLGRLGYRVSAFTRSPDALAAFRATPDAYALIISDLSMPDLDGAALIRAVRGLRPTVPCVMLSGHFGDDAERLEKDLGVRCCLQKPVSWRRVAETIRELLEPAGSTG